MLQCVKSTEAVTFPRFTKASDFSKAPGTEWILTISSWMSGKSVVLPEKKKKHGACTNNALQ